MDKKIYVWATDKFLSGWGCAEGKIHKQVVECPSWAEADRIEHGFENDPTYKNVNHGYSIPSWSKSRYSWTIRPSSEFTIYK